MNISNFTVFSSKTLLLQHLVKSNFRVPVGFDWGFWNEKAQTLSRQEIRETIKTIRLHESVRFASDCTRPTITSAKLIKTLKEYKSLSSSER
jgi:hypothetical protein